MSVQVRRQRPTSLHWFICKLCTAPQTWETIQVLPSSQMRFALRVFSFVILCVFYRVIVCLEWGLSADPRRSEVCKCNAWTDIPVKVVLLSIRMDFFFWRIEMDYPWTQNKCRPEIYAAKLCIIIVLYKKKKFWVYGHALQGMIQLCLCADFVWLAIIVGNNKHVTPSVP
jgi:hypothetical protein